MSEANPTAIRESFRVLYVFLSSVPLYGARFYFQGSMVEMVEIRRPTIRWKASKVDAKTAIPVSQSVSQVS